ncbi:MAG: hypothetical protein DYG86_09335 [Chloroflexi bacterium CFX2]|nr:hypothetical protein [Chloroflexi bacterium CFX2]
MAGKIKPASDFRSIRFVIGNEVQETTNFRQVSDRYKISMDWKTASLPREIYKILFEVAKSGNSNWANVEQQIKTYTLNGTPGPKPPTGSPRF